MAMLPQGASQAFDDLMNAAHSLASTPIKGSNTMPDTEIKDQLKGTAASAFKWLTSPRQMFTDVAEQRALEKGTEAIAEAITNPAKRAQLRQVVKMAPGTRKAFALAGILTGNLYGWEPPESRIRCPKAMESKYLCPLVHLNGSHGSAR